MRCVMPAAATGWLLLPVLHSHQELDCYSCMLGLELPVLQALVVSQLLQTNKALPVSVPKK